MTLEEKLQNLALRIDNAAPDIDTLVFDKDGEWGIEITLTQGTVKDKVIATMMPFSTELDAAKAGQLVYSVIRRWYAKEREEQLVLFEAREKLIEGMRA